MAQGRKGSGIEVATCSVCGKYQKIAHKTNLICHTCYKKQRMELDPEQKRKYIEYHRANNKRRYDADPEKWRAKSREYYHRAVENGTYKKKVSVPRKKKEQTEPTPAKKVYVADEACSLCGRIVKGKEAVEFEGQPAHQVCIYAHEARSRLNRD